MYTQQWLMSCRFADGLRAVSARIWFYYENLTLLSMVLYDVSSKFAAVIIAVDYSALHPTRQKCTAWFHELESLERETDSGQDDVKLFGEVNC